MFRILLIDDDPQFRKALHIALRAHDYDVAEAADAKDALDVVAVESPDLVVLDWHFPKTSGLDTCRAVRASSSVPIIMVSANRSNSKQIALEAGANDYLAKPFPIGDLLTRIESALKQA